MKAAMMKSAKQELTSMTRKTSLLIGVRVQMGGPIWITIVTTLLMQVVSTVSTKASSLSMTLTRECRSSASLPAKSMKQS